MCAGWAGCPASRALTWLLSSGGIFEALGAWGFLARVVLCNQVMGAGGELAPRPFSREPLSLRVRSSLWLRARCGLLHPGLRPQGPLGPSGPVSPSVTQGSLEPENLRYWNYDVIVVKKNKLASLSIPFYTRLD